MREKSSDLVPQGVVRNREALRMHQLFNSLKENLFSATHLGSDTTKETDDTLVHYHANDMFAVYLLTSISTEPITGISPDLCKLSLLFFADIE